MPFLGCFRPSLSSRRLKRSRSSARSIESTEVPRIGAPDCSIAWGRFGGVLAAKRPDDALRRPRLTLLLKDGEHVLGGQRFEVEAIRRVVVGRHGLWIA